MNALTTAESSALSELPASSTSAASLILGGGDAMNSMMRVAELMASGRATVPAHLQKNSADCMAVVMQAMQWRMNPFAVAQKTHVVNGTLGYEAQLVNAAINTMAPTKDRLHFEWFGDWKKVDGKNNKSDDLGVRVWATLKGEDEPRELLVTMAQAGVRNSPLWVQDPRLQLAYLATKRWARLYVPDVILGVYTPDEFQAAPRQMGAAHVVHAEPSQALIDSASAAADGGMTKYGKFWGALTKDDRVALAGLHAGMKSQAEAADASRTLENKPAAAVVTDQDGVIDQDFVEAMDSGARS